MTDATRFDHPLILTFLLELPFDAQLREGATVLAWEREHEIAVSIFNIPPVNPGVGVDTRFVFRRSSEDLAPPRTVALEVFDDF